MVCFLFTSLKKQYGGACYRTSYWETVASEHAATARGSLHVMTSLASRTNSSVLIVGGGSGLGLSLAHRFLDEGWETVVVSRSPRETNNPKPKSYPMPENEYEIDQLVANHLNRSWSLVLVVSGGGFGKGSLFEGFDELTYLSWVNFGLPYCFLKALHEATISTTVVMFGSIAARENIASPAYALAKKQLEAMVRIYGRKLIHTGLNLIGLSPGGLFAPGNAMDRLKARNQSAFTDFLDYRLPRSKFLLPEDIFSFLIYLANSDASVWAGSVLSIDGGESTHL